MICEYITNSFKSLFGHKSPKSRGYAMTEDELAEEVKKILGHPNCIRVPYTIDEVMSLPPKVRDVVWPGWRKYAESNPYEKEH